MASRGCYLMIKPPRCLLPELEWLRHIHGIDSHYAADRLHSTLLPLDGDQSVEPLKRALADFTAPPFRMIFDRLESATLKPSDTLRGLHAFHAALLAHLARTGVRLPRYKLDPHLNLSYGQRRSGACDIDPISWLNDELLLIESAFGRHRLLARWKLTPPNRGRYRDTGCDRPPSPAAP